MTFRQGKHTFARIPRRALADQPKLQKLRQMAAELDIDILSGHLDSGMKLKEKVLGPEFHKGIKTGLAEMGIAAAVGAFGGGYGKVAALGIEVGGLLRGGKKSSRQ
mgnify:CR=1 FL=1